jgi:16S rRNA (guanine(966)-N(2))-methyltransferase RsmD
MRIIAGKHRGRTLVPFQGKDIRPTADRVKESLFQILGTRLYGARVLDLFAGSGALGIESLSRGAAEAVFNDCAKESVSVLGKNLAAVKESGKIYCLDYSVCLKTVAGKFDLIFADPPYAFDCLQEICAIIKSRELLCGGGILIYESEREAETAEGFELADFRSYGRTKIAFYQRSGT